MPTHCLLPLLTLDNVCIRLTVPVFQEALKLLKSEKEAYSRERATEIARIEAITREYDDLRRRAAVTEAELSR